MKGNSPELSRIRYFEGQLLAAPDLRDDDAYEQRLRGLHVRALHNTWGVALGFEVSRLDSRTLRVGPGVAYDTSGREIVASRGADLGPPTIPGKGAGDAGWWFDLVAGPGGLPDGIPQNERCDGGLELAALRWCLAGPATKGAPGPASVSPEARLGDEVPLVRCLVGLEGAFEGALDLSIRRRAQALTRPHIAGGRADVVLRVDAEQRAQSAVVSTATAGFSQVPSYFARLSLPAQMAELALDPDPLEMVGPFVTVRDMTSASFTIDLRIGSPGTAGPVILLARAANRGFEAVVDWIGIEPNGGCPPEIDLARLLFFFHPGVLAASALSTAGAFQALTREGVRHG